MPQLLGKQLLPFFNTISEPCSTGLRVTNLHFVPIAETARRSGGAGAVTALFLSAFHVTMLIAFIGAHLWLGRILGLIVGIFLIITGNELPPFASESRVGNSHSANTRQR